MKATHWTTAVSADLRPAVLDITKVGRIVYLTVRQRNANGTYSRMRIAFSEREAKKLAFDLAAFAKVR